jgi:hypothetical protein
MPIPKAGGQDYRESNPRNASAYQLKDEENTMRAVTAIGWITAGIAPGADQGLFGGAVSKMLHLCGCLSLDHGGR